MNTKLLVKHKKHIWKCNIYTAGKKNSIKKKKDRVFPPQKISARKKNTDHSRGRHKRRRAPDWPQRRGGGRCRGRRRGGGWGRGCRGRGRCPPPCGCLWFGSILPPCGERYFYFISSAFYVNSAKFCKKKNCNYFFYIFAKSFLWREVWLFFMFLM